ncbi:phage late control D family protein [Serratia fonticola]|uniref:phage late control D family protein n=1 Tax=Serratia fonticola TaxID=47917 RepID=UPI001378F1F8|nr:phage late control D family protein [Serratia fonticola]NBJ32224.1 phage late control D family protein [Serratia fonticola]
MSAINALDVLPTSGTPAYSLKIDGADITGKIEERLISLTLTDNRGFEADQLDIELDDSNGTLELPRRGVSIAVSLGWKDSALVDKGTFTVDEIEHSGAPDKLVIRARSADFRATLNIQREASYHQKTIGDIIKTIASRHKLTPAIHKNMADVVISHIDQTNESDASFMTRLAKENGAIVTVKKGSLLFFRQGQNQTVSGKPIPLAVITRSLGDGHQFSITDRAAYTGVVANWLNTRTAKAQPVKVKRKRKKTANKSAAKPEEKQGEYLAGSDENVLVLRHTYASKYNAERAAKTNWERLQRGVATFSIQLARGRADLYPEAPVAVSGFKRQIDEAKWTLVTVTHSLNGSGFTTSLDLEVKIDELEME